METVKRPTTGDRGLASDLENLKINTDSDILHELRPTKKTTKDERIQLVPLKTKNPSLRVQPATQNEVNREKTHPSANERDEWLNNIPPCSAVTKILIAEDNLLTLAFLESTMERWGIYFVSCSDGLQALKHLQTEVFDLALVDLQLSGMRGPVISKMIRKDKNNINFNTPVIAITATEEHECKKEIDESGMNGYLPKPLQPEILFQLINSYTPSKASNQQLYHFSAPFDNRTLNNLYHQDFQHIQTIFDIFLRTTPEALKKMEKYLEANDLKNLEQEIHKIKPSFSMIGLDAVAILASRLEQKTQIKTTPRSLFTSFYKFQSKVSEAIFAVQEEKKRLQLFTD